MLCGCALSVMSVDAVCNLWMLSVMSMWMRSVCNVCVCGCALSMMSVDALCLMLYVISVDALCLWMRSIFILLIEHSIL